MTATLQSSNQASIHVQHLILSSDPNHLPGFPFPLNIRSPSNPQGSQVKTRPVSRDEYARRSRRLKLGQPGSHGSHPPLVLSCLSTTYNLGRYTQSYNPCLLERLGRRSNSIN